MGGQDNDIFMCQSAAVYLVLQFCKLAGYKTGNATLIWQLADPDSRLLEIRNRVEAKFKQVIVCVLNPAKISMNPAIPVNLRGGATEHLAHNVLKTLSLARHPSQVFCFGALWFLKLCQKGARYVFDAPVLGMLFLNSSQHFQETSLIDLRQISVDSYLDSTPRDIEIGNMLRLYRVQKRNADQKLPQVERIQVVNVGCCGNADYMDVNQYANKVNDLYHNIQFRRRAKS